jgi:hypothetical protein
MNKYLALIALTVFLISCKGKRTSLASNDEGVDAHDFIGFFQPLKLPYEVGDTLLRRKEDPASLIHNAIFNRLVPDSVLSRYFNKEAKPRLYAIGKVLVPGHETYLFVKASAPARKVLFILCFSRKEEFAAARPVLYSDNDGGSTGLATLDTKYTLTVSHQRKVPGGQMIYHRDAYVFNDAGTFTLIMTESNEGASRPAPIYNPIDTVSHRHKYTGDYALDKRNLISIRDGKDPSRILFFVHFEKDDGNCKGELKGMAKFISPTMARYTSYGDPCMIEFSFGPSSVSMKEIQGCGNHRDIKCFFEGDYPRRKETSHPKPGKKGRA